MPCGEDRKLSPYLSPAGAWALALGTSIGWGSLVVTSNTYLLQAGPAGSAAGMAAGALLMLVIGRNYHYLMNCFPDAGGAYTYTRESYGYDHAFLIAWFLSLTYLAMLWANATALPLFARYFLGEIFEFGKLYTVFGYGVYIGEALLTIAAILIVAMVCCRYKKAISAVMTGMALFLSAAVTVCFLAAMSKHGCAFHPRFVPDKAALSQILKIAVISPWAFVGFENISHSAEEFSFRLRGTYRVLAAALVSVTLLYVFITLLSASAYPPQYASWLEYIRDLENLEGIEALPAFYAAQHYMGGAGVGLLTLALLMLVITSLIGNTVALSRLFYVLAKDGVLPPRIAELNERSIPDKAILLIAGMSFILPFVGRTAIGWIVDVTTLGATIVYAFVSACAVRTASVRNDRLERWTGGIGLAFMTGFMFYLLLPNLFAAGNFETVSYFLFVIWAVLGFFYFRMILKKDNGKRFGRSVVVWIALLSLVLFVSLVWMSQSMMEASADGINAVEAYYRQSGASGAAVSSQQLNMIRHTNARSIIVVCSLIGLSLAVLLKNYSLMSKRAMHSERQLGIMTDIANTDPLTGVKSKRAFADMEHAVEGEIREGRGGPFSFVVCDVNGLKHINDTLGHKAGDEYIKAASKMICELFQHSPVYRMGGDEFAVFLRGRDYEKRYEIMEVLHRRSVENISGGGAVVSGGLSDYEEGKDLNIHAVFERADALMYREKQRLKGLGAKTRE